LNIVEIAKANGFDGDYDGVSIDHPSLEFIHWFLYKYTSLSLKFDEQANIREYQAIVVYPNWIIEIIDVLADTSEFDKSLTFFLAEVGKIELDDVYIEDLVTDTDDNFMLATFNVSLNQRRFADDDYIPDSTYSEYLAGESNGE